MPLHDLAVRYLPEIVFVLATLGLATVVYGCLSMIQAAWITYRRRTFRRTFWDRRQS